MSGALIGQEGEKSAPATKPKSYGVDQVSYFRIAASEFSLSTRRAGSIPTSATANFGSSSATHTGVYWPVRRLSAPSAPGRSLSYVRARLLRRGPHATNVVADLFSATTWAAADSTGQLRTTTGPSPADSARVHLSGHLRSKLPKPASTVLIQTRSGSARDSLRGRHSRLLLQVSPPPQFADFNDVRRAILLPVRRGAREVGITGGCGNGNYCPDAPLTRGQMAVFLAKALGLQWP